MIGVRTYLLLSLSLNSFTYLQEKDNIEIDLEPRNLLRGLKLRLIDDNSTTVTFNGVAGSVVAQGTDQDGYIQWIRLSVPYLDQLANPFRDSKLDLTLNISGILTPPSMETIQQDYSLKVLAF